MATLTEVLPATKSSRHGAIRWTPADDGPAAGTLTIDTDRARVDYAVTEFPTGWDGRGFHFEKTGAGTDADEAGYDVFVARNRQDRMCSCKGFTRHGHCKHVSAALALIENGWL